LQESPESKQPDRLRPKEIIRKGANMNRLHIVRVVVVLTTCLPTAARAALIMEPVINRVAGSGQGENNFPIYDPDFTVNGVAYWTVDEPGEILSYVSGDPRDPFLDVFHVWNNTSYDITGLHFKLVGTGTDSEDPGTIVRGPVDAVWGDVNGDGRIGQSDIFTRITASADGKEIHFEDGLLPVGGRFTDIHLARSDSPPFFAAVDSWFAGNLVPEPSGAAAFLAVGLLSLGRRR
jgi:hypothetical protein